MLVSGGLSQLVYNLNWYHLFACCSLMAAAVFHAARASSLSLLEIAHCPCLTTSHVSLSLCVRSWVAEDNYELLALLRGPCPFITGSYFQFSSLWFFFCAFSQVILFMKALSTESCPVHGSIRRWFKKWHPNRPCQASLARRDSSIHAFVWWHRQGVASWPLEGYAKMKCFFRCGCFEDLLSFLVIHFDERTPIKISV